MEQIHRVLDQRLEGRERIANATHRARQVDDQHLPASPAVPRDSAALGCRATPAARSASAMPGASVSSAARVASGVRSRAVSPVPPVVRITSTSPPSAQATSVAVMADVSSGTTARAATR